jgi:hypothetical protein
MHVRRMAIILGLFAAFGVLLWGLGHCAEGALDETTFDADAWLDEHGEAAEAHAGRLLAGESPPVPDDLARYRPRRLDHVVAFTMLGGGFREDSQGLCFAPGGRPPRNRKPQDVKWRHVRGEWWFWKAEFL